MSQSKQNYYGDLCTELYKTLHRKAPQEELAFYRSYAEKGRKILEPLCGRRRFLVGFTATTTYASFQKKWRLMTKAKCTV